jgi:hypothetical protein
MTSMIPTWDCRTPLNVNDSDIRPEMKVPPTIREGSTDALFAVVRSEMGDFARHSNLHLDFINPRLKSISQRPDADGAAHLAELVAFEKSIEERYLKHCNPENPVHFMTLWTTRCYLARYHLFSHYARTFQSALTDQQRDAAMSYARRMLECDTLLNNSPLTIGYQWLIQFHFPFPAYLHILQDLRKRPYAQNTAAAWQTVNDNYTSRFRFINLEDDPRPNVLFRVVAQAWKEYQAALNRIGQSPPIPEIITSIQGALHANQMYHSGLGSSVQSFSPDFDEDFFKLSSEKEQQGIQTRGVPKAGIWRDIDAFGRTPMNLDPNQFDWSAADWNPMNQRGF